MSSPTLLLFALLLGTSLLPTAAAEKPNIVLILIDDLSHYGVSAYGSHQLLVQGQKTPVPVSTPRMDRLATQGTQCRHAFAYPLCEPTRIALMTGQLNSRNFLQPKAQHNSQITFGDLFQRAGYATGMFGKWKQTRGTRETPGKDYISGFGWDDYCCFDVVGEGQRYINPNLVTNGKIEDYRNRKDLDPATGRRWYGPDIFQRHSLDFIERHQDRPFFLYYPSVLVHDEHKPTPDTRPASLFDNFDEANNNKNGHTGDDRRYLPDMIAYLDKQIGEIVDKIDALGLRERTLILVMGDNGTKEPFTHILPDGSGYPGGKGATTDNGLRVPLLLSWPGHIPSGPAGIPRSYDGLVDIVDIYPTLCEAAGIPLPNPKATDGISFWPQATGASGEPRRDIYTWYNANNPDTDKTHLLRYAFNKDFKRYAPHTDFPEGRFFDLRTDPLELAGDRSVKFAFAHVHHSGLKIADLTPEQKTAYDALGLIIDQHAFIPVTGLQITASQSDLPINQSLALQSRISPENATRQNLIWESSDPAIASIDKFGTVTAHRPGPVKISVYSWDDARPLANNLPETFSHQGISQSLDLHVK